MDLAGHGLKIVERALANFLPLDDRRLPGRRAAGAHPRRGGASSRARDAERLDAYDARLEAIADVLRDLVLETPPNMPADGCGGWPLRGQLTEPRAGAAPAQTRCHRPPRPLALFAQSAGDWLDGWFESDPIKAAFGFDGVVGQLRQPLFAGLRLCAAAPRLRRGERQEGRLGPRHRRHGRDHPGHGGGLRRAGVEIAHRAPVREVLVEKGRAVGVVTARRARRFGAASVVANVNPKLLFQRLVDPAAAAGRLPRAHRRAIAAARAPSA